MSLKEIGQHCNEGEPVINAPNCESGTTTWACTNLGGFSGTCVCAGDGC
ncbi:hypothetical protein [Pontimicrobium aquaticum]|nr:hypothetical protein [Pontimicrobium aquaticum]